MGCDESKEEGPQKPIEAAVVFEDLKLQSLITPQTTFANDFEKDIFMAINVLRHEPACFDTVVEAVKQSHPLAKNCKHTDKLLKYLENNEQLSSINWDRAAMDACKKNNEMRVASQFTVAPLGGNKDMLIQLLGGI